jgi:hypothetical protein
VAKGNEGQSRENVAMKASVGGGLAASTGESCIVPPVPQPTMHYRLDIVLTHGPVVKEFRLAPAPPDAVVI